MGSVTTEVFSCNEKTTIDRPICGFWRRVAAFLIDSILLSLFGLFLGMIFRQQFTLLGELGPLVGLGIIICYFGIMNSHICNGQSIGKKLLKIRVVNKEGNLINVQRSCFRAAMLGVLMCNGLMFTSVPIIEQIFNIIMMLLFAGIIYFYIFNKNTRQSIHDLVCKTYVYKAEAVNTPIATLVSKLHYVVYSIIVIVMIIASGIFLTHNYNLQSVSPVILELNKLDGVYAANVNIMTTKQVFSPNDGLRDGNSSTTLNVNAYVYKKPTANDELQKKIAGIVLDNYPAVQNLSSINVNICWGYNIGIANSYMNLWATEPPQKWKEKIQK